MEIAQKKDIDIVLKHTPRLPSDFEAYLINSKKIIDRKEYVLTFARLIG